METIKTATIAQNESYLKIYNYLVEKVLPELKTIEKPMLVFSRNTQLIGGYFSPSRWKNANDNDKIIDEIGINANVMKSKNIIDIIGILVHEMLHSWDYHFNKERGTQGYHSSKWIDKAREIGLNVLGTGRKVETSIADNSKLSKAIAEIPNDYLFPWLAEILPLPGESKDNKGTTEESKNEDSNKPSKSGKRTPYICPICGINVWGKHGLSIICGNCIQAFVERS